MKKLYRVRNNRISVYNIIRETETRYFVGQRTVRGGYIMKGAKSDFLSYEEAKSAIHNMLSKRVKKIQDVMEKCNRVLAPLCAAVDAISDDEGENVVVEMLKDAGAFKAVKEKPKTPRGYHASRRYWTAGVNLS